MSQPSAARIASVRRATTRWRKDLVDTSGRNRLRRYRDLKTSTLDLTPDQTQGLNARALDRLLADKPVSLSDLFSEPDSLASSPLDDARRRLTAIHKRALTNREEKGIETCFAGIGLARWTVEQGTDPNAPVILLPLQVKATSAAARDFGVEVGGDAHLNPVLTHILGAEHDIDTEDDEADVAEDPPTDLDGFRDLLARLEESWSALPDLIIEPRVVVAIFSYSTMPLVTDLEKNGELFAESDIVAAIAGDGEARDALRSLICDPAPDQPDIDSPADEFLVLDADSSQHLAINRVLGGESLVIQGPPGTGKSQTIVNLITALIARGKRVLFVAEKRAAIEAVTKRLEQVGLSDLVMDMHGRITSRRDFARTLADSLGHVATIPARDYSALHGRLQARRDALVANDAALHALREPWKLCVFHMQERLLTIPEAARTPSRLSTEASRTLDRDGFERLSGEIEEWLDLGGHTLAWQHPEWSSSSITTTEEARQAFDLVRDLAHERLPAAREALFLDVGRYRSVSPGDDSGLGTSGGLPLGHRADTRTVHPSCVSAGLCRPARGSGTGTGFALGADQRPALLGDLPGGARDRASHPAPAVGPLRWGCPSDRGGGGRAGCRVGKAVGRRRTARPRSPRQRKGARHRARQWPRCPGEGCGTEPASKTVPTWCSRRRWGGWRPTGPWSPTFPACAS